MYRMGDREVERVRRLVHSGKMFRYGMGGECDRFERDWGRYLGVRHVRMTNSGTTAIYAALVGLGVGPGVISSCQRFFGILRGLDCIRLIHTSGLKRGSGAVQQGLRLLHRLAGARGFRVAFSGFQSRF